MAVRGFVQSDRWLHPRPDAPVILTGVRGRRSWLATGNWMVVRPVTVDWWPNWTAISSKRVNSTRTIEDLNVCRWPVAAEWGIGSWGVSPLCQPLIHLLPTTRLSFTPYSLSPLTSCVRVLDLGPPGVSGDHDGDVVAWGR